MKKGLAFLLVAIFCLSTASAVYAEEEAPVFSLTAQTGNMVLIGSDAAQVLPEGESAVWRYSMACVPEYGQACVSVSGAGEEMQLLLTPLTRMSNSEGGLTLREGVVGIDYQSGNTVLETPTEIVEFLEPGRLIVRVDDYGNAFNYCLEGSVSLFGRASEETVTIQAGQYVAVTVKRDIKSVSEYDAEDIDELNVDFTALKAETAADDAALQEMRSLDVVFGTEDTICDISRGEIVKITATSGIAHDVFVECDDEDAEIVIYDSEFQLIRSSLKSRGALKPYVYVSGESESVFYVQLAESKEDSLSLRYKESKSIYVRSIELVKSWGIPILVALAAFLIFYFVTSKFRKKRPQM